MPRLVKITVVLLRAAALFVTRGNHHGLAFVQQRFDQPGMRVMQALSAMTALRRGVLEQASAPWRSWACPGVSKTCGVAQSIDSGVNLCAQAACRLRPRACFVWIPFAPALCWWGAQWSNRSCCTRCPHPAPGLRTPAATHPSCSSVSAGMHDAKVAESRWQVAPGDACAVAVQHGIDEQAVVLGSGSRLTCLAGQQIP